MKKDKNGTIILDVFEDNIQVPKSKIEEITREFKKYFYWYQDKYTLSLDLREEIDNIYDNIEDQYKEEGSNVISLSVKLLKKNYRNPASINWGVLELLHDISGYLIEEKDFDYIEEFLNTPPGKELEAWEKWNQYWEKRRKSQFLP